MYAVIAKILYSIFVSWWKGKKAENEHDQGMLNSGRDAGAAGAVQDMVDDQSQRLKDEAQRALDQLEREPDKPVVTAEQLTDVFSGGSNDTRKRKAPRS